MKKFSSDYYLYYLINISLVIIFLFPIYWTIISSLKTPPELISKQQTLYPHTITFEYYERILTYGFKKVDESENVTLEDGLLSAGNIFIAFKNSFIVTIGTIILSLIVSTLGGYAFTFYKFKFKEYFFIFLLLPILIPSDFILAFLFISSEDMKMLNVALKHIATGANQWDMKWGDLTAGSVVSFIPLIIFYAFLQQYFVRGITGGSVKE